MQSDDYSSPVIQDSPGGAPLLRAVVGGIIGAVLGGVVWSLVGVITNYEVGYVAIVIGFFTGYGVVLVSQQRGMTYQLLAAAMAIVGIFLGKYYLYYHFNRKEVVDQFGQAAWDSLGLSLFSSDMIEFFFEDLPEILAPMDLLFVGLAILVAWGIPSIKNAPQQQALLSEDS